MTTFAFIMMPGMIEWIVILFVLLLIGAGVALVVVLATRKSNDDDERSGSGIGTVLIVLAIVGGVLVILCAGGLGLFAYKRSQQRRVFIELQDEEMVIDFAKKLTGEDAAASTPPDAVGTLKPLDPNEKEPEPARPETEPEAEQ